MNLENSIKDIVAEKLEDGTVKQLVEKQFEKGLNNVLDKLFSSYSDVGNIIESQLKSVIIPYLEGYDYSRYITKLDAVLTEVLKKSSVENEKLLKNFKKLIEQENLAKNIKVTDLFERWKEYVSENVDTDELEVDLDDEPSYQNVEVTLEVIYDDVPSWSIYERGRVIFECEHDENMNCEIQISRWKDRESEEWNIEYKSTHDINSLRYLDEFEILLMKLTQNNTRLILDSNAESDEVTPEEEPEPTFL
ncbi:hypothetical protein KC480_05855 [Bacillus velezensis]|uniref:hypothetical protein n=1 Tax=Bacillus velezensis TaxID=492670 RepID=UPI001E45B272|nr:hypothetical protein [Bacillus velezensis]MCD7911049.1 hypothetical protein [Bacillus velezensis]